MQKDLKNPALEKATINAVEKHNENTNIESFKLQKRIGSTVYLTKVYFNRDTTETIDDKIIRLIKNDLNFASKNVTMTMLHTGGLPERSSA